MMQQPFCPWGEDSKDYSTIHFFYRRIVQNYGRIRPIHARFLRQPDTSRALLGRFVKFSEGARLLKWVGQTASGVSRPAIRPLFCLANMPPPYSAAKQTDVLRASCFFNRSTKRAARFTATSGRTGGEAIQLPRSDQHLGAAKHAFGQRRCQQEPMLRRNPQILRRPPRTKRPNRNPDWPAARIGTRATYYATEYGAGRGHRPQPIDPRPVAQPESALSACRSSSPDRMPRYTEPPSAPYSEQRRKANPQALTAHKSGSQFVAQAERAIQHKITPLAGFGNH